MINNLTSRQFRNNKLNKKIFILIGTRPNFIKVTQFKSLAKVLYPAMQFLIIHTGQHYDEKMADVFFRQFDLHPDYYLNIAAASPNKQVAEIMIKLENLCDQIGAPDLMLVTGDVNSTLAGALFANKQNIQLGHIEAGLRSFDKSMPEEHNRIIVDQLSDLFFVTEQSGMDHLMNEKHDPSKIHFVGNTMIDTMEAFKQNIKASDIVNSLGLDKGAFVLMTIHRPSTVDDKTEFSKLMASIEAICKTHKIVFPIHPRTVERAKTFGLHEGLTKNKNLICIEPLDYFAFQNLIYNCSFVVTDSGGIQEETTFLQKPCLTLRANTERPITVVEGSNTLLNFDLELITDQIKAIENGTYKKGKIPKYWDGNSTKRILKVIQEI